LTLLRQDKEREGLTHQYGNHSMTHVVATVDILLYYFGNVGYTFTMDILKYITL